MEKYLLSTIIIFNWGVHLKLHKELINVATLQWHLEMILLKIRDEYCATVHTCVMVHECPLVSPPKLRSNGHQARQGLVTDVTPLHFRLNVLQMAAPRAAISIPPSNGVGTCVGAAHACPTQNFYKRGVCHASGLTFQLAVGWDTSWTTTLAVGAAECLIHI